MTEDTHDPRVDLDLGGCLSDEGERREQFTASEVRQTYHIEPSCFLCDCVSTIRRGVIRPSQPGIVEWDA